MLIDRLIEKIKITKNPTCVGLDTDFTYLPTAMQEKCKTLEDVSKALTEFNINILEKLKDIIPSVKVQVAYYEKYGCYGMKAFSDTLDYAKKMGLITIADIKRNDIGATAGAYSNAYLSGVEINGKKFHGFDADFITVNGYLGSDGILPFINDCKQNDKGLFVLVKTSNPTSGELQDKKFENGNTLYQEMATLVDTWGKELVGEYGFSNVGAVVGATHPSQAEDIRAKNPNTFFLIPGYGAQGGSAEDLRCCFREDGLGGIVNNSRGIICAYKKDKYKGQSYIDASYNAALDMRADLLKTIKNI